MGGDSGFIVVREKQVLFKSPSQQHSFNFPYQVSSLPKYSDNPMSAQTFNLEVKPGELAHVISKITMEVAADTKRDTPFSYGARQVGFPHEFGGKMDDVTVVVSYIMRNSKM